MSSGAPDRPVRRPAGVPVEEKALTPQSTPKNPPGPTNLVPLAPKPPAPEKK
ncbi:MAG: hypothetical protein QOF13_2199 [Solirubrobacterales bacterium]|jgi:hypothetical protein|nr:hypothetical protein [Solirubrobacterales bacterium]